MKLKGMRMKGIIFTTDMIIGLSLAIVLLLLIPLKIDTSHTQESFQELLYQSNDLVNVLSTVKASAFSTTTTISGLRLSEEDLNQPILDLIGSLWYSGYYSRNITLECIASNITKDVLENLTTKCFSLKTQNETIYPYPSCNQTVYPSCNYTSDTLGVSQRIASGYASGEPVSGYAAGAFLTSIRSKITSSYAYFGGYVGQGNITRNITLSNISLPLSDNILEAYMELDAGNNFTLYINGNYAGFYPNGSAGGGEMRADKWNLTSGNFSFFHAGENTLQINFSSTNNSYIGGGYFKVTYNTTEMAPEEEVGQSTYWFPGIQGLINLYDSFYVPGNLENISIHLHYRNNYTTYLTIGNKTVHEDASINERIVDITDADISSKFGSKENLIKAMSDKTVPIRLGTSSTQIIKQPNADVILITDLSGSMDWEMDSSNTGDIINDCTNPAINNSDTKRISVAKCLDKEFTDIIMSASGNRMGLIGFNDNANVYTSNLDSTRDQLIAHINNYPDNPSGGTCISCAINRAYNQLNSYSNASRQKFIIVMSDGVTGYCSGCSSWFFGWCLGCNSSGTSTSGQYSDCGGTSADCTGNNCLGAMQNANYSSCRVHNDLNVTVHSIGFGPVVNCPNGNWTLHTIANCGNGSYYASTDTQGLEEIYRKLAESIVKIGYIAQIIEVKGGDITKNNILYPDSYIELNYTPTVILYEYGEISLTREKDEFKNFTDYAEGWFNISEKVKVVDAKVTSYSSEFWTDRLYVKNSTSDWNTTYWLGDYSDNYPNLGDPFIVQIPVNYLRAGNNSVRIGTGFSPNNATGGSPDDKIIYTIRLKGSVGYGGIFNTSELANDDARQRLIQKVSDYVDISVDDVQIENEYISGVKGLWASAFKVLLWERK